MGLDMYLTGVKYFDSVKSTEHRKLQEMLNSNYRIESIKFNIGYWRKVNCIHNWFVTNVQEGVDDCGTYYVSKGDIQKLSYTVWRALNSITPSEILPTKEGSFFGSTSYDVNYYNDLKDTKQILEKLKDEKFEGELYYHSSW
jgi:hypothetical protein